MNTATKTITTIFVVSIMLMAAWGTYSIYHRAATHIPADQASAQVLSEYYKSK